MKVSKAKRFPMITFVDTPGLIDGAPLSFTLGVLKYSNHGRFAAVTHVTHPKHRERQLILDWVVLRVQGDKKYPYDIDKAMQWLGRMADLYSCLIRDVINISNVV